MYLPLWVCRFNTTLVKVLLDWLRKEKRADGVSIQLLLRFYSSSIRSMLSPSSVSIQLLLRFYPVARIRINRSIKVSIQLLLRFYTRAAYKFNRYPIVSIQLLLRFYVFCSVPLVVCAKFQYNSC